MKNRDVSDTLYEFLGSVGRLLFYAGALACVIGLGFLVMYVFKFANSTALDAEIGQALKLTETFGMVLLIGAVATSIGSIILFWGEDVYGALFLIVAAAIFFVPVYLPGMTGSSGGNAVFSAALAKIQQAGSVLGLFAIGVLLVDVAGRVKDRIQHGSKADTLKYGKGMKEEKDFQNVFLGRCWQLPYCRKFVRERCPIYHARTTCWKERVGCMCEEKVIQTALTGGNIPKDMVAAAKFIPRDNKIPPAMKIERCRQCVIYNERQRQKYKLVLPVVLLTCTSMYLLFREPMKMMLGGMARAMDRFMSVASFEGKPAPDRADQFGFVMFQEVLSIALVLMLMAYLLKVAEYIIFKLKL